MQVSLQVPFIVKLQFRKRSGIVKLNNPAQRKVMRLKLQKRSELKFVSRTILHKQGIIPRSLLWNLFPTLALGFRPGNLL